MVKIMDKNQTLERILLSVLVLIVMGALISSCNEGSGLTEFDESIPRNVWLKINNDSVATRDTVLRVNIGGENVSTMQISSDPNLENAIWQPFDTLSFIHAERVEGSFRVYGRFASAIGGTTGVLYDDIELDFTARILRLEAATACDTLEPGNRIEFIMETSELGSAKVSFGSFIVDYRLTWIEGGLFRRDLIIPNGIPDGVARLVGRFTDFVGNVAQPFEYNRVFVIRGARLNPQIVGYLNIPFAASSDVWYHRGFCFVSDWEHAVHVINVIQPDDPIYDHRIQTADWSNGLSGNDGLLVVADSHSGVAVIGMNPPQNAAIVGREPTPGMPKDVDVEDETAYVATYNTGLRILDLRNPRQLRELSRVRTSCNCVVICRYETTVYVGGVGGLAVIDVADPEEPELLAELRSDEEILSLVYYEGSIFAGTNRRGVLQIDVNDPTQPELVAEHTHLSPAYALAVSSPFMFVCRGNLLNVVNVTEPLSLPILAEVPDLACYSGLFVKDQYLYTAVGESFTVVDLFSGYDED